MVYLCNALLYIFIWVQVTSSWHLSTQNNEASYCRARTTPFQVACSISTIIQITVLVMGYFKVSTGENISMLNSQNVCVCVFFFLLQNMTVIETEKRKSYSSSTSFCTQRKVNYMEASILGSTAWTWGFSLCPFITFCWLASPSCNIPTVLTGEMLTHAWL